MADFSYRIENGIAYLDYVDEWTFERVADVHRRLAVDPAFDPDMPKIIVADYLMREFDMDELIKVRDYLRQIYRAANSARRIAVVSSDTMIGKLTELYSRLNEMGRPLGSVAEYRFFTRLDEAEAWVCAKSPHGP